MQSDRIEVKLYKKYPILNKEFPTEEVKKTDKKINLKKIENYSIIFDYRYFWLIFRLNIDNSLFNIGYSNHKKKS